MSSELCQNYNFAKQKFTKKSQLKSSRALKDFIEFEKKYPFYI